MWGTFQSSHKNQIKSRFIVSLPLKRPMSILDQLRYIAQQIYQSTESMQRNQNFRKQYWDFKLEYEMLHDKST